MGEAAEEQDLERQLRAATAALRKAVLRLLRAGEVDPRLIVLAAARVTGELGAAAALAGGEDVETRLRELAEVVRQAGREQHAALRAETLPVARNA